MHFHRLPMNNLLFPLLYIIHLYSDSFLKFVPVQAIQWCTVWYLGGSGLEPRTSQISMVCYFWSMRWYAIDCGIYLFQIILHLIYTMKKHTRFSFYLKMHQNGTISIKYRECPVSIVLSLYNILNLAQID